MDLLSLELVVGLTGLFMFLIGIGLGKLFDTTKKIRKLGLDRPLNLNFTEQMVLYFHYPSISIPITFAFFGGLMIIVSVVIVIIGMAQKFFI